GSQLVEEVLADSPGLFRYRISDFTSDQRFVVDHGLAEFRFAADDDGTRLEWTYSFLPMSADLRPVVEGFLETVMTPMMTATLTAMRDGVEATEL
ncbi:SRPBCC family protein, partial [Kibdelosporangium lantanae]